jgi:hypothetical protein
MHLALLKTVIAAVILAKGGIVASSAPFAEEVVTITIHNNLPSKQKYRIVEIYVGPVEIGPLNLNLIDQVPTESIWPGRQAEVHSDIGHGCLYDVSVVLETGENIPFHNIDVCEKSVLYVNTD